IIQFRDGQIRCDRPNIPSPLAAAVLS
ncbi:MAG: macrolide ABC transporter ATP-binding protein, partial [Cyanobacteria bacterium J003]